MGLCRCGFTWSCSSINNFQCFFQLWVGIFIKGIKNGLLFFSQCDLVIRFDSRTIAGLNSFHQKLILIAGGYDKKIPFEPLAPKIIEKVKTLILMGVTAPKIEAAVTACEGFDPQQLRILHAKDMQQAVELARQCAQPGDIVSLSPACASFDLYPDFEARGRHFKELVHQL